MGNPLRIIEKALYWVRDFFWDYPDRLISNENSFRVEISKVYKNTVPYSHFVLAFITVSLLIFSLSQFGIKTIFGKTQQVLTEAVIMGVDDQGRIQRLNKVNPILPTNIQLEKDIVELVYEPLIKYEYLQKEDGLWEPQITKVLANDVIKIKQGADYEFTLKKGVKWHDGFDFNANDVIQTFDLVSKLSKSDNAYIRAIKQLRWEKIDNYTIRLCTKSPKGDIPCDLIKDSDKQIFANFLELISIKILPSHKIKDITDATIDTNIPELFRSPVGTGKYKFQSATDQSINLVFNEDYQKSNPEIKNIQFKFYKDLSSASQAIQNGEVDTVVSLSVEFKKDIEKFNNIKTILSPVLVNQYWGLYFNLKTNPDGNTKGPKFFQDVRVRKAISSAINREEIISNALLGVGMQAYGPITDKSSFFNKNAGWMIYDPVKANSLLNEAGWTFKNGSRYRTNSNGEELRFSIYYVSTYDRGNIAKVIQKNLADIGIYAIIDRRQQPGQDDSKNAPNGWSLEEINEQILTPKSFDVILYGMNTFIDPDRYELFHSSQQEIPGLNIASYSGLVQSVKIRSDRKEGESSLINIPKVDKLLEDARGYDPEGAAKKRLDSYNEFQSLIAQDAPVVFLYNPQFIYYTNSKIKKIDLSNVSNVEDRFKDIDKWELQ